MIKVQPQGQIYLCKTPLESDYKNQLTFTDIEAQQAYFLSTVVKSYDENTYIRRDGGIKIGCNAEEIRTCNYMFYRNTGFDNRIYYCFITNIEYLSENSCFVSFETDCFQTWYFDLDYKPCFVEREHVDDDTIGLHTVPEGLETGEYQINNTSHYSIVGQYIPEPDEGDQWYVCFVVTQAPDPNNPVPIVPTTGYEMGAVFTPLTYFAVKTRNQFDDARDIINWYRKTMDDTTLDTAIKNIYMIPYSCVDTTTSQRWVNLQEGWDITVYAVKSSMKWLNTPAEVEDSVMAGSYTPKNNKLFTYPYSYLYLDNKCGSSVIYHWEDGRMVNEGTTEAPDYRRRFEFYTLVVPSASLSAKLFPYEYKGKAESSGYYGLLNYGINFGKVPLCAWTNDYYTNWLTQNGVNMNTQTINSIVTGAVTGAVATGGSLVGAIIGGATGGLTSIMSNLAKTHEASVTPPQASGDVNVGDVTFAYTFNNITAYHMTIRREMSEIIDNYFTMYGYKVNVVKTPSITGRAYWNYVKTIDCNIEGNVPQEDLQVVRNIFNKGCTFWHGAENMYNYNLNNSIVS